MAFSLIGLYSEGIEVVGRQSIDVSYPDFIDDINSLSGKMVIN